MIHWSKLWETWSELKRSHWIMWVIDCKSSRLNSKSNLNICMSSTKSTLVTQSWETFVKRLWDNCIRGITGEVIKVTKWPELIFMTCWYLFPCILYSFVRKIIYDWCNIIIWIELNNFFRVNLIKHLQINIITKKDHFSHSFCHLNLALLIAIYVHFFFSLKSPITVFFKPKP